MNPHGLFDRQTRTCLRPDFELAGRNRNFELPRRAARIRRGAASKASPSSSIAQLKDIIQAAIDKEDYEAAAFARDQLRRQEEDAQSAVEEVNRMFYVAFQNADLKMMKRVWGRGEHVQCFHPMTPGLAGHDDVLAGWGLILKGIRTVQELRITLKDIKIHANETQAFVTCTECMEGVNTTGWTAATNIFEKQDGQWMMIHHQGGPLPAPSTEIPIAK